MCRHQHYTPAHPYPSQGREWRAWILLPSPGQSETKALSTLISENPDMPSLSIHFSSRESNNAYIYLLLSITSMNFRAPGTGRYFYNQLNKCTDVHLHLFHKSLKQLFFLIYLTLRSGTRSQLLSHRGFKEEAFTVVIYNVIPDLGLLAGN